MKSLFISKIIVISITCCIVFDGIVCASISSTVATNTMTMTAVTPSPIPRSIFNTSTLMPSSTSVTSATTSSTAVPVSSTTTTTSSAQSIDAPVAQPIVNCDNATMDEINKLQLGGCPVVLNPSWLPGRGGSSPLKIDCLLSTILFVLSNSLIRLFK